MFRKLALVAALMSVAAVSSGAEPIIRPLARYRRENKVMLKEIKHCLMIALIAFGGVAPVFIGSSEIAPIQRKTTDT